MLKTLVDLFLLLSNDKKTITSYNMSIFYQFITKKILEIENHHPTMLITSLDKNYINQKNNENIFDKGRKGFFNHNELMENKDNKKIIIKNFQNELLFLFNDMIDYLNENKILILSNDKKDILTNKINKKIKSLEKIQAQNIEKEETRNFIIELMNLNLLNNNFIYFNFTINHFINFFNSQNKDKNRLIAVKFINFINPIIKMYKNDIKIARKKNIYKSKTKSLSKISIINIYNNKSNESNTKKKIFHNFNKINKSLNNKLKDKFNLNNMIIKKIKRNTAYNKKRIEGKENLKKANNISGDTLPCQTLNNCISFNNSQVNCFAKKKLNNNIKIIKGKSNDNQSNIEKLAINELNYLEYQKNFKNKTFYIPNNKMKKRNQNKIGNYKLGDLNIDKNEKKRKTNITVQYKNEEKINFKQNQCFIF